ncbi:type II toxin-antitoxin system VapC family toxin [Mumia sp. ZJ430]|uniref:type II toxin-antitoxin system VapC family toxin n=1 Tax=Mumia sp. ZJ430 TaxID=2708083 RepID=UPI0014219D1A|nr:type II toxin-antitoxin system VapC family toxin [Mumia sp. ZJ430]
MTFILDTNVVSEVRFGDRMDARVRAWLENVPEHECHLSAITVFELAHGVARIERRDSAQGRRLREWFERQIVAYEARILPIDLPVARETARLHVPDPRPERDAFIAATAIVHGMTVVTRSVADFSPLGVPVVNPWE